MSVFGVVQLGFSQHEDVRIVCVQVLDHVMLALAESSHIVCEELEVLK